MQQAALASHLAVAQKIEDEVNDIVDGDSWVRRLFETRQNLQDVVLRAGLGRLPSSQLFANAQITSPGHNLGKIWARIEHGRIFMPIDLLTIIAIANSVTMNSNS